MCCASSLLKNDTVDELKFKMWTFCLVLFHLVLTSDFPREGGGTASVRLRHVSCYVRSTVQYRTVRRKVLILSHVIRYYTVRYRTYSTTNVCYYVEYTYKRCIIEYYLFGNSKNLTTKSQCCKYFQLSDPNISSHNLYFIHLFPTLVWETLFIFILANGKTKMGKI